MEPDVWCFDHDGTLKGVVLLTARALEVVSRHGFTDAMPGTAIIMTQEAFEQLYDAIIDELCVIGILDGGNN